MITLLEFLLKKHIEDIQPSDAIDLGLPSGTLWCSHNVGAKNPEDFGNYFAWGETKPKKEYFWDNYKFGEELSLTKYNKNDHKIELDLEDDAVHVNMGEYWRMPTEELIQELINESENKWTTQNGINGKLFTSKKNNNSIFIPAAGFFEEAMKFTGVICLLWSSTLDNTANNDASYLRFDSSYIDIFDSYRYYGFSVRGVING